jgi:uncharacterized protein
MRAEPTTMAHDRSERTPAVRRGRRASTPRPPRRSEEGEHPMPFGRIVAVVGVTASSWLLAHGAAHAQSQSQSQSQAEAAPARVVMQVSDADPVRWNLALNNVRNVRQSLGATGVEIELVAYGPGIGMLKTDSVVGDRIADALKDGVKVVACQATMSALRLTEGDMLPRVGYVPSGAVELIRKQQQGYAYLRP